MALIKCSKCSETVSTKAPACPHCGSVTFNEMSETKSVEKLPDELGSISAAISAEDEKKSSTATVEQVQTTSQTSSNDTLSTLAGIVCLIVAACTWYHFGIILAGKVGLCFSVCLRIFNDHAKSKSSAASSQQSGSDLPKRVYSTGDIILYTIFGIAMAFFWVPALYIMVFGFERSDPSASAEYDSGPDGWSSLERPESAPEKREPPPTYGIRPERFPMDQLLRVPNPGSRR